MTISRDVKLNGKGKNKNRKLLFSGHPSKSQVYRTDWGFMLNGKTERIIKSKYMDKFEKKVDLIFTSPPYPLNTKKKYGNLKGEEYVNWLVNFGPLFKKILKPTGSIVIEMGNSWEKGSPIMSTLAIRSLLEFLKRNNLHLCQEFVWNNPAKLPTPAQWVNIERIRVKDSFTKIWWMSPSKTPRADNRKVLVEYSDSMKKLLERGYYNSGIRISEHRIGEKSFLKDNDGAISGSVLTFANTASSDPYLKFCKEKNINPHPARMPMKLAEFFIKFLTKPNDLVFDPFGGSNITGFAAESLGRFWISVEDSYEYIKGSIGRFNCART